jgi:protein-tyrosine phosphatase
MYAISEPSFIIDNIYLGSAFNAASFETLQSLNIGYIFNMTNEITNYFPDNFIYHKFELDDNNKDSIKVYLDQTFELIQSYQNNSDLSNKNIFVHCFMGRSRSASIVIYYLMKKYSFTFENALEFVLDKRPIVNPTFRFTKDLCGI